MTRGANLRGHSTDRYRREVREPLVRVTAWLPLPAADMTSPDMRAALAAVMAAPSVGAIPYEPVPSTAPGLYRCDYRITEAQRGMLQLVAALHGVSMAEALRGILAGMEATR